MKSIVFTLGAALLAAHASAQATLHLANGEWPPYQSASLPQYGFASAVVSEAAQLGGIRVQYGFYPWKRAEEMVRNGHIDGSLVWSRTPLRDTFAVFSAPVFHDHEVVIHRADRPLPDWPQREHWQNVKLALPLGYRTFHELVRLERQGRVEYQRVENPENGLRMILAGRLQAMTLADSVYQQLRRDYLSPQERARLATLPTPVETVAFRLMLSRARPQAVSLLAAFNHGLQQLRQRGRYAELARQLLPAPHAQTLLQTPMASTAP